MSEVNGPLRVFLCHSSADKPTVRELYQRLNAEGWIDIWLDEEKLLPGQDWDYEIEKALDNSDAIIVALSTSLVSKEGHVQKELRFVLDLALEKPEGTVFVFPVRLDDCELPRGLRSKQSVDYFPAEAREKAYFRLRLGLELRANILGITTAIADSISDETTTPSQIETQTQAEGIQRVQEQPGVSPRGKLPEFTHRPKSRGGVIWKQVFILSEKDNSLNFSFISHLGRSDGSLLGVQRHNIDLLIAQALRNLNWDQSFSTAMFELLIPHRLKGLFRELDNFLFVLDEGSARYPWEIIHDSRSSHEPPLFTQVGMIRQFSTNTFIERIIDVNNRSILVVGNPANTPANFGNLPGAEREAMIVADKFEEFNYSVDREIHTRSLSIMNRLLANDYRILHLAGHGVYQYSGVQPESHKPAIYTGMVLGDGIFLTANEINNLLYIPELVFINCAHLGKIDKPIESSSYSSFRFAASIPQALLKMGAKAVIAPGWDIDDAGAMTFAEVFYDRLLEGELLVNAVKEARQQTYSRHKDSNTWAAYQCYGDPAYRLVIDKAK